MSKIAESHTSHINVLYHLLRLVCFKCTIICSWKLSEYIQGHLSDFFHGKLQVMHARLISLYLCLSADRRHCLNDCLSVGEYGVTGVLLLDCFLSVVVDHYLG